MTVCIIDTSVFCEILKVPGKSQNAKEITAELADRLNDDETLLLPMATILETGNHIGHVADGRKRREAALRFIKQVKLALSGDTPFSPTPIQEAQELLEWIDEFPDSATHERTLGDLSIIKTWEVQCKLCPRVRVYIWSVDRHLSGYDKPAERVGP